jgi:hypothetical protein
LRVEEGRYVAARIPGAKYVELEGKDHLPFVGNQNEILQEIQEFVTRASSSGSYGRVLATVFSIRLVDASYEPGLATAKARKLSEAALQYIRKQIDMFRGHEILLDNKNILAAFDGPARAIRCARASLDSAERFGVSAKAGLDTGECDVIGQEIGGTAVELAQRICEASESGAILVSRTVRDLVAGSGLKFAEFGTRVFKGIEGERHLFSVQS